MSAAVPSWKMRQLREMLAKLEGDEQAEEVRTILNEWRAEGVFGEWSVNWAQSALYPLVPR